MAVCLLPEKVNEFLAALKTKSVNIADLITMSTEARTELLREYAGDNAKEVNTLFEEKLVLKNRIQGIKNWAEKVGGIGKYGPEGKAALDKAISDYRAQQQERIFSPKENEAFLNDLADRKIGIHISREVAGKIFEMSAKLDTLRDQNPKMSGVSDEYLKARNDFNSYVAAQKPITVGESLMRNLSIIGRNNLILNPSTPFKTTEGQIINSTMDAITRRIAMSASRGAASGLAAEASKEAWTTFRATGDNTAAMEGIDDTNLLGSRSGFGKNEDFKVPAGGPESQKGFIGGIKEASNAIGRAISQPGKESAASALETTVRKVAQGSNKVAIDFEHNITFTKFYQKTFFDMANLSATDLAKGEGLTGPALTARAEEIFRDAARIEPQTQEGALVRMKSQEQAARITSTSDTLVSELSVGLKKTLNLIGNRIYQGFNLGDFIVPIAKIPANIIANGIDNAGAGLPKGVIDIFQGHEKIQSADLQTRYEGMVQYASGIQRLSRITGTLGLAALMTSTLGPKDFKSDQYGSHFVHIGGTWINTEYISAISPALAGMMQAKQKGTGAITDVEQYMSGTLSSLKNVPGIDEASKLAAAASNTNFANGLQKYASDFFTSRGEPAFLSNLLKDRPIQRLFFGATGVETDDQTAQDAKDKSAKAAATRKANKAAR